MKKQIIKSLIPVVAMGAVLVFAFCTLFLINGGSRAWLAENRTVGANGMSVSVDADKGESVSISSHPVTEIDKTGSVFMVKTDEEVWELPRNDPNGISYSKYKKALAIFIDIVCTEEATVSVYLTCSTESVSVAKDNYVSNCVEVAPATLDGTGTIATVAEDGSETEAFRSLVEIKADYSACTKNTSVLLQENVSLAVGTNRLCFLMQYHEHFLKYAENQSLSVGGKDMTITYNNDIAFSVR
ncbi:MAG: hypothetical protein SOT34_04980 [Candidatus Borkfalkiaceae bacterium]|nr:hypothetical protein [Christensenellaceae bacterium]